MSIYYTAKHPVKMHIWADISKRGQMGIRIFKRIMETPLYIQVLQQTLLPFLQQMYPEGHQFMADNDPKHTYVHRSQRLAHSQWSQLVENSC